MIEHGRAPDGMALDALPTLAAFGFTGGRNGLRAFVRQAFQPGTPRFLRTEGNELAIFRNRDLTRLAALTGVGAVPPAVLFGPALNALGSDPPAPGSALAGVIANQVFTANPPIHKPVRKALLAQLGPKQVAAMEPVARNVVDGILGSLPLNEPVDAVAGIAERLTCGFWGEMLGMSADEIAEMVGHVRDLTPMFFLDPDLADVHTFDRGATGYRTLIEAAVGRSLAVDPPSWIGDLARDLAQIELADDPGGAGIVPRSAGALLAGNLIDGFHTAALAAANTLYVLCVHPGLLEQIAETPALLPNAIFEALRIEPPVLMLKRWALTDLDIDGWRIPRGTVLAFLWGAGGFDPDAIDEPTRFDLHRSRLGITTFGGGVHLCPGRYVAAMLVRVLVENMLARGWRFRPPQPPEWVDANVMGQMRTFAIIVEEGD